MDHNTMLLLILYQFITAVHMLSLMSENYSQVHTMIVIFIHQILYTQGLLE